MIKKPARNIARIKRHRRIRNHLAGTPVKPRLSVFRSNKHIYAQIIDDDKGHTLCTASTMEKAVVAGLSSTSNIEAASIIGKTIAERAKNCGITTIVFDRGGYLYHGKVKALAEAARESGLEF